MPKIKTPLRYVLLLVGISVPLALVYFLIRSFFDWPYGIAPISVGGHTAYVKYHDCGAICSGQMYITQNPKRCAWEDPAHDYLAPNSDDTLDFAVRDNRLFIAGDHWQSPPNAWLPVTFVPTYGHVADQYHMTSIMFANHLPFTASTGIHIEVRPCRVFPDGLFDGTWREWIN
jgi:hypothetical protein